MQDPAIYENNYTAQGLLKGCKTGLILSKSITSTPFDDEYSST